MISKDYKKRFVTLSLIIVVFLIVGNFFNTIVPPRLNSSYNHLYSLIEVSDVKDIVVTNSSVTYSDTNNNKFKIDRVADDDLLNYLYHSGAKYTVRNNLQVGKIASIAGGALGLYLLASFALNNKEKVKKLLNNETAEATKKENKRITGKAKKAPVVEEGDVKSHRYVKGELDNFSSDPVKKITKDNTPKKETKKIEKVVAKPEPIKQETKKEIVDKPEVVEKPKVKEEEKSTKPSTKAGKKTSNFNRPGTKHNRAGVGEKRGMSKSIIDIDSQVPIYKQHHKEELDD